MAAGKHVKIKRCPQPWDYEETKQLICIWSDENRQQQLKIWTRKNSIWEEIALHLQAAGYERNASMCRNKIHYLMVSYSNYMHEKPNKPGCGPPKKPLYFEELDRVLGGNKVNTPKRSTRSSGEEVNEQMKDTLDNNNCDNMVIKVESNAAMAHERDSGISNNSSSNSTPSCSSNNNDDYFKKINNKRSSSSEILFDRLNESIFVKDQFEQQSKEFLASFFKRQKCTSHIGVNERDERVVKVRRENTSLFIEIELTPETTFKEFFSMITEEYNLDKETKLVIK